MNALIKCSLLIVLVGCSTVKKTYDWEYVTKRTHLAPQAIDMEYGQKHLIFFTSYPSLEEKFHEFSYTGQINNTAFLSCFDGEDAAKSFNFINILRADIRLFRPFLAESKTRVRFKRYTQRRADKYFKVQTEVVEGVIDVRSKGCYRERKDNGDLVWIVSEIYN